MRSTHSLFHSISSASFAGILPYFLLAILYVGVCNITWLPYGQYNCWRIIDSVLYSPGWSRYVWYHLTTYFWSNCGINILSLNDTSFMVFLLPQKEPFLYSAHISFSVRIGSSRWYWSVILKDRGNLPSCSYSMS